jgi:hypothetical protein
MTDMYYEGYQLPESQWVHYRFLTWSPVNEEAFVEDSFYIQVFSNGESQSDLCDWSNLNVKPENVFTQDREYRLSNDRTEKKVQETLITAKIEDLESLADPCKERLHATIDFKTNSGRWNTTWNSTEAEMGWYSWMIDYGSMSVYITEDDFGFRYLVFNMSQE